MNNIMFKESGYNRKPVKKRLYSFDGSDYVISTSYYGDLTKVHLIDGLDYYIEKTNY